MITPLLYGNAMALAAPHCPFTSRMTHDQSCHWCVYMAQDLMRVDVASREQARAEAGLISLGELHEYLVNLADTLECYEDARDSEDGPKPNRAARALDETREWLAKVEKAMGAQPEGFGRCSTDAGLHKRNEHCKEWRAQP